MFAWGYDKVYGIPSWWKEAYGGFVHARETTAWWVSFIAKSILLGVGSYFLYRIFSFAEKVWHNFKKTNSSVRERRQSSPPRLAPVSPLQPHLPLHSGASFSREPSAGDLQQLLEEFSVRENAADLQAFESVDGSASRPPSRGAEEEAQLQAALADSPFQEGANLRGSFMGAASFDAMKAVAMRRAGSAPVRERPRASSSSDLSVAPVVPTLPEPGQEQERLSPFMLSRVSGDGIPERVTGVLPRVESPRLRSRPGSAEHVDDVRAASSVVEADSAYTPAAAAAFQPSYLPSLSGNVPTDLMMLQAAFFARHSAHKKS